MMQRKRIGEFLSRSVPLTLHDVEEILIEQRISSKRFGDIALSLGMCKPEHVWHAWMLQLAQSPRQIDLDQCGIDTQAVGLIDAETARQLRIIPIRRSQDEVIIATDEASHGAAVHALAPGVNYKAVFVLAHCEQIDRAICRYYSTIDLSKVPAEAHAA